MIKDFPSVNITGHVRIVDDLGQVLLDKFNAVHPQNVARIISRSLANESNYFIHRIAFGNGGTLTNAAYTITYNTPNDGQPPDVRTWNSRLYNETYSEIVNEGNLSLNTELGTDPGSAGPNAGTRPGGGADPSGDPTSIPHVSGPGVRSNELGLTSEVVISSVLNPGEPSGQFTTDNLSPTEDTESSFTFDELGLYTTGAPAIDSSGSQDVDVNNRTSEDDTGLLGSTAYDFSITVDGGSTQQVWFETPASGSGTGGEILYGDLCEAINTGDAGWNFHVGGAPGVGTPVSGSSPLPGVGTTISITDNTLAFSSITGSQTYGFLRFTSGSSGATSTVQLAVGSINDLFAALNPPTGGTILSATDGEDAGVQNDPVNPTTERERLLTHLIFSPVTKAANRTLSITYTLTVSVTRS